MVELDAETEMSRTEAATFLREFADELQGDAPPSPVGDQDEPEVETMTVIVGGESATVVLPDRLAVDVAVGSSSGLLESDDDQRIDLELSWAVEEYPEDDTPEIT